MIAPRGIRTGEVSAVASVGPDPAATLSLPAATIVVIVLVLVLVLVLALVLVLGAGAIFVAPLSVPCANLRFGFTTATGWRFAATAATIAPCAFIVSFSGSSHQSSVHTRWIRQPISASTCARNRSRSRVPCALRYITPSCSIASTQRCGSSGSTTASSTAEAPAPTRWRSVQPRSASARAIAAVTALAAGTASPIGVPPSRANAISSASPRAAAGASCATSSGAKLDTTTS